MYPPPGIDYAYFISNDTAIDPKYGTIMDFDHLVAKAKSATYIRIFRLLAKHNDINSSAAPNHECGIEDDRNQTIDRCSAQSIVSKMH